MRGLFIVALLAVIALTSVRCYGLKVEGFEAKIGKSAKLYFPVVVKIDCLRSRTSVPCLRYTLYNINYGKMIFKYSYRHARIGELEGKSQPRFFTCLVTSS